jgi:hypothetical protein
MHQLVDNSFLTQKGSMSLVRSSPQELIVGSKMATFRTRMSSMCMDPVAEEPEISFSEAGASGLSLSSAWPNNVSIGVTDGSTDDKLAKSKIRRWHSSVE